MSRTRTTARIATVAATVAATATLAAGTALAAGLGTDVAVPPVAAGAGAVATGIGGASPTPSPTTDPVGTVTAAVNGVVDTAKETLGVAPSPSSSPRPTGSPVAPAPAPAPKPAPAPGGPARVPALPHTSAGDALGTSRASGGFAGFSGTLGDRRPALVDLPAPSTEQVRGVGAVAAPTLPRSVSEALPDEGRDTSPLPGLLVVCASVCVAAVAAGNAEVWRRRLATALG